jgi:hypothetical protein
MSPEEVEFMKQGKTEADLKKRREEEKKKKKQAK